MAAGFEVVGLEQLQSTGAKALTGILSHKSLGTSPQTPAVWTEAVPDGSPSLRGWGASPWKIWRLSRWSMPND